MLKLSRAKEKYVDKINDDGEEYTLRDYGYEIIHLKDKHISFKPDLIVVYSDLLNKKHIFARSNTHQDFYTLKGRVVKGDEYIFF